MLPSSLQMPTGAALVLIGLVACFFGYRFFRIVLAVYGFVLGALFASTLVHAGDTAALFVALGVGGLLGAAVLWFGYIVGVALAGGALGIVVARAIWTAVEGTDPGVLVPVFGAVAGAALAVKLQKQVMILATAFVGAETAIAGLMPMITRSSGGRPGFEDVWIGHLSFPAPGRRWTFICWVVLGAVGAIVQFRAGTARRLGGRAARKAPAD